jgi:molybdate transport system substrate-binding protein
MQNLLTSFGIAALMALAPACRLGSGPNATLTVSAASSLQRPLREIGPAFERSRPGVQVRFNFGGSGTLERQIENGAPADLFLPASSQSLDRLEARGLLAAGTRRNLVRNRVVLVAPRSSATPKSFEDLAKPEVRLVALGEPSSVPAGEYGRQALVSLGLWSNVQRKLLLARDVHQVLAYVETGNAEAGIVYSTDARESEGVRVVETAPETSHAPVVYPVAVIRETHNPEAARDLVDFLAGKQGAGVFTRHGFTPVAP